MCGVISSDKILMVYCRTSRQRSNLVRTEDKEPTHVKLGVVARLKSQVGKARSNKDMAAMVTEFDQVTNRSTGRTITKVSVLDYTACRS